MAATSDNDNRIKYLSVDEMMLKIMKMRAARPVGEPEAQSSIEEREIREPVYAGRSTGRDFWADADDDTPNEPVRRSIRRPLEIQKPVPLLRAEPNAHKRALAESSLRQNRISFYAFNAITAGIAVLILLGVALHLMSANQPMLTVVPEDRNLIAGSESSVEIPGVDSLVVAADPAPPVRHLKKVSPAALEKSIHDALVSNGFPDIGVSASHSGEVYLAGEVYSPEEAGSVVKVARLATHGRVFFLHPDVQSGNGRAYFGAMSEYAPEVWGARIRNVVIGSPAYKAGVRVGDVIREFDHKTVADARDLEKAIAEHTPGSRVSVRIWRAGENRYSIARLTGLKQFASR